MKEFNAQTGGRYTYADDILNLQALSLAILQIFDECDNFIISGCQVSGNKIGSGFVFLNGKIRKFAGASNVTQWPQYIYESNRSETVAYASGADKVGRTVYGCASGSTVPSIPDPITGSLPASLPVRADGGLFLKDAFIGKYALLLNSGTGAQTVNTPTNFSKGIATYSDLDVKGNLNISKGPTSTRVFHEENNITSETRSSSGVVYKFTIEDGTGFKFFVNSILVATFTQGNIKFSVPVNSSQGAFGGTEVRPSHIFNSNTASDDGVLNINMMGYNGSDQFFRDTCIGNGKGQAVISVLGSKNKVLVNASTLFHSQNAEGIAMKTTVSKLDSSYSKTIVWKDSLDEETGSVGFVSGDSKCFQIVNKISDISILGQEAVNIGPAIKENGILLSTKYVLASDHANDMVTKADASSVYTIKMADANFATKKGGFNQFINSEYTQDALRTQLGAYGSSDMKKYPLKASLLSDMATNEEAKKTIRTNIGAAGVGDFQTKLKDTGWIQVKEDLYIRQIGNIVSVQGIVQTVHNGPLFNIPSNIDPPIHDVYCSMALTNARSYSAVIHKNSRQCVARYCDGACGRINEFTLIYMV